MEHHAVLNPQRLGEAKRNVDAIGRAMDDARQEAKLAVREERVSFCLRPIGLEGVECLIDDEALVDCVDAKLRAVDGGVHRLAAEARVRSLADEVESKPEQAGRDGHDRERGWWRGWLGNHDDVTGVAAFDCGGRARLVVADLFADDSGKAEITLEADTCTLQCHGRVGLGEYPGLHVARPSPPNPAVAMIAGERIIRRPSIGIARWHDIDVAIEDERAPTACAPQPRDGVVAAWFDRKQLGLSTRLGMDCRDELCNLALATNEFVVRLSGVLRLDACDPHRALHRVDQFWCEFVNGGEDAVLNGRISWHLRSPLVPA